jgi:ABC-type transport system involved in multi-copper enzyme maturation permease subunit
MIESLQSLQWLSLFHYYDATADAILNGQAWSDILILLAVALVFFGLAVFFFGRRDITVGHWPWGRGRVPASA